MKTLSIIVGMVMLFPSSLIAQEQKQATQQQGKDSQKQKTESVKPAAGSKQQQPESRTAQPESAQNTYLVIATHNPGDCSKVVDDLKAKSQNNLNKFWFGCVSGDHTIYGYFRGNTEQDVRKMLPESVLATAKIERVERHLPSEATKSDKEKGKGQPGVKEQGKGQPSMKEQGKSQDQKKVSDEKDKK